MKCYVEKCSRPSGVYMREFCGRDEWVCRHHADRYDELRASMDADPVCRQLEAAAVLVEGGHHVALVGEIVADLLAWCLPPKFHMDMDEMAYRYRLAAVARAARK